MIAVVDSGIDEQYCLSNDFIVEPVGYLYSNGLVSRTSNRIDVYDRYGHGTMCIDYIHKLCPNAKIKPIKILNDLGKTNVVVLEKALEDLIDSDIKIINLSLSLTDYTYENLENICNRLNSVGKYVVASFYKNNDKSIPASLSNVVGVKGIPFLDDSKLIVLDNINRTYISDNSPVLVKSSLEKFSLFWGNSKATCIATSLIYDFLLNASHDIRFQEVLDGVSEKSSVDCDKEKLECGLNRTTLIQLTSKVFEAETYCCRRLNCDVDTLYKRRLFEFRNIDSDFICGLLDIWYGNKWRINKLITYDFMEWFYSAAYLDIEG